MECPRCHEEWEALVVNSTDGVEFSCPVCSYPGRKKVSKNVSHKIFGFTAKNSYGLKKFDDGR
jgi:hypothetical protein